LDRAKQSYNDWEKFEQAAKERREAEAAALLAKNAPKVDPKAPQAPKGSGVNLQPTSS